MSIRNRMSRRHLNETGAAMVLGAIVFAFLALPLCALGVDTARWWVEAQRIQAAADAAATAGVTYMPEDFAAAKARALTFATSNGYAAGSGTTVTVAPGGRPTQLRVTISATVDNYFAQAFGVDTSTITRTAVADFNGPAPMGSPCNLFANEPDPSSALGPTGTALKIPAPAICTRTPQFWGAISGPEVYKGEGSQYDARKCAGGEVGCSSSSAGATNTEFDLRGFIYLVRVSATGVGTPINLQIYDPAHVPTGLRCQERPTPLMVTAPTPNPTGVINSDNWNDYANTDALTRYRSHASTGSNAFCTGDDLSTGNHVGTTDYPTITSFGLRSPINTLNPYAATPVPGCVKQYPGFAASAVTANALKKGHASYNGKLAQVFHQWKTLCTFTPTAAGDYYLQVRTNVALGGVEGADGVYSGNLQVYNQTIDDTNVHGTGKNHFSLRAVSAAAAGSVSVAPYQRMRIYANADSATTTFNLVRVAQSAARKTLVVTFFDVGEGASSGSVKLLKPVDSNLPTNIANCTASGVKNGALTNCEITGITPAGYNGKLQTIRVPIPNDYTCTYASQGGCWVRAQVSFGSGTVTDSTTWTAQIIGDPVRLVE